MADVREHLRDPPAGGISLLPAFVANAPQDHRRVVAVPVDEGHQVFFGPVVKESGVAVVLLGPGPGVRELVHHQETHAVAQVQQFRGGRVVAAADGVATHLFQHFQTAHPCVIVPGGAQGTGVVVQAHALEEGFGSVQVKAVGLEFGGADAEGGFVGVLGSIGPFHYGTGYVHLRVLRAPEAGVQQIEGLDHLLAVVHALHVAAFGHHILHVLFFIEDAGGNGGYLQFGGLDPEGKPYVGVGAVGLRGDKGPPVRNGGLFRGGKPHVAVQAAAGIPAGTLRLVVQGDFNDVAARLQERVQLHGPGGVTVRPAAGFLPVHQHLGVGESAVYFQPKILLQVLGGYFEDFGISGLAPPGQLAGFSGILLQERLFHAPVVREVQFAGVAVLGEIPVFVPGLAPGGLGGQRQRHRQRRHQGRYLSCVHKYANIRKKREICNCAAR